MLTCGAHCPGLAANNPGLKAVVTGLVGLPTSMLLITITGAELFTGCAPGTLFSHSLSLVQTPSMQDPDLTCPDHGHGRRPAACSRDEGPHSFAAASCRNVCMATTAVIEGKTTLKAAGKLLLFSFIGNALGCFSMALLAKAAGLLSANGTAVALATMKTQLDFNIVRLCLRAICMMPYAALLPPVHCLFIVCKWPCVSPVCVDGHMRCRSRRQVSECRRWCAPSWATGWSALPS